MAAFMKSKMDLFLVIGVFRRVVHTIDMLPANTMDRMHWLPMVNAYICSLAHKLDLNCNTLHPHNSFHPLCVALNVKAYWGCRWVGLDMDLPDRDSLAQSRNCKQNYLPSCCPLFYESKTDKFIHHLAGQK